MVLRGQGPHPPVRGLPPYWPAKSIFDECKWASGMKN